MNKSKIFLILCLSFIIGIAAEKYLNLVWLGVITAIAIACISLGFRTKSVLIFGLAILMSVAGSFWFKFNSAPGDLPQYYGQKVEITGIVSEDPDRRLEKTFLTINDLSLADKKIEGKLLITVSNYPEFSYGHRLQFVGKIQEPNGANEPGEFSYKNYLSRFGIEAVVYYPSILGFESGKGNRIKSAVLNIKYIFNQTISALLPEPESSFLSGILIGARKSIPQDLIDKFNRTGTTHLIAISGFNITIIAQALGAAFSRLGRRASFVLSVIAIILFVILTGASASVVRAAVMGILALLAVNIGRLYVATNALAFTALIMLFENPKVLRFDVGFQLSFLALGGLVYLVPVLEHKFPKAPEFVKKYLMPTLAAQIFTLPVILYNFDRVSIIAPLTNLLVLPLIPLAMLLGFMAGIAGLILPALGAPMAWAAWLVLHLIVLIIEYTSQIPFGSVELKNFPMVFAIAYSLLVLLWLCYHNYPWLLEYIKIWKPKPKSF